MAALMGIPGHSGGRPAVRGASELHARGATEPDSAGPDMLSDAAVLLPEVAGRGQVHCADVHAALYQAASLQGLGRDRPHRLELADTAMEQLAGYLVATGLAEPAGRPMETVHSWLAAASPVCVQLTLAAAGGASRAVVGAR